MDDLGTYEGHTVLSATVAIRNTGHGLEEAMKVEPVKLRYGSVVHVVLECVVDKHRYEPHDKENLAGPMVLVNMLKAGRATIVDAELVEKHLDDMERKISEAAGTPQLPVEE